MTGRTELPLRIDDTPSGPVIRALCGAEAAVMDRARYDTTARHSVPDASPARVLPYREARDEEDEKHVHPLQLDVIDRVLVLRSNPGERVLTPFMGVGSEVYAAVRAGRYGIGAELKPSYYRQALKNLAALDGEDQEQPDLFDNLGLVASGSEPTA